MANPSWNPGSSDKQVPTQAIRKDYIYDRLNQSLMAASIVDAASFNALGTYLGYASLPVTCQALSGVGSPSAVVTPDFVGQYYVDNGSMYSWVSTGLTNSDWQQLNGTGVTLGVVPPTGVFTPQFLNQIYNDTVGATFWHATGFTPADWTQLI